ncbi:LysR family transcriptional regulator [Bordetella hinzii]|uniref:LysR family transcriptional regulator n=1 Tax=Bordetella hinzii TaxID=103855 RepID=A0AAN1VFB1_9BORD|nr:LysR family transcriptional regulator [Bordetella hinzii]AZW16420.1 LysR family transcriptional regulator [Bordetella hinzii]KXA71522.1 LysR family transcriptional regulator [Bordetella hinzii LMG 13501]MBZ0074302.1 LysR family transcriptional regulator [Bordetella hinzii]MBZ0080249.1 LysR family transcriptional regulator [Bordetella hinzii]MBZ0083091.1 LysR family transcriptional regulator [Bordetella hinzii]
MHALNKLNYRQTEMLWAIVMAGSISGAARLLNISQPAVSRMLAHTEKAVGVALFERVRGRLRPTSQVQSLFEEIEKTQRMMQRVNDLADALAEHGTGVLRLASIPSLAQFLVPRAVARFQQQRPDLLLRLNTTALPVLIADVLQGEAELGLVVMQAEHPFLVSEQLHVGRMVAAIPKSHPLAARASVTLADLSPHPHIVVGTRMPYGMLVLGAFEQAGLPCRMVADVPWSQLACALVSAGVGIAIVDEFTVMPGALPEVAIVPLVERIPLTVSAVYANNREPSPIARQFIRELRGVLADAFPEGGNG